LANPKSSRYNLAARSQFQVLRLDVAMNDLRILRVQVIERITKLVRPPQDIALGKRTLTARLHFKQILAGNVLHHQELAFAFGKVVADTRQA
jgi:hypothetical protein